MQIDAHPRSAAGAFAARIGALAGWRRAVLAILLGALAALALPPVHALPVLWVSFPLLIWLADGAPTPRGAFLAGWAWGFGHFSAGFYWIANALLLDVAKFGWMIPFAVFGLGGLIGLFPAAAAWGARRLAPAGAGRVLAFAGLWMLGEWLRSWVGTGFPWNLIATVWMPVVPMLQTAAWVGAYGLGLLTVLVFAMPAVLAGGRPGDRRAAGAVLLLALAVAGAGWLRLPAAAMPVQPGVHLRLVQGNIEQTVKWQPELRAAHLETYLALSRQPWRQDGGGSPVLIWPETAVPYLLDQEPEIRRLLAGLVSGDGLVITGAPRATPEGVEPFQIWNSLMAVDGAGRLVAAFDKSHLVPFGEYVPLGKYLPLVKVTAGRTDFTPGPGPRTLFLPGLPPVAPSICYEDIFPAATVAADDSHPAWMLNVTNDGWFGRSAGPFQHFAAARMRAVEEGLPMVRVGNTGVTGIIDPYGRVTARLPLGIAAVLDGDLPRPAVAKPLFARMGDGVVWPLLALVAALIFLLNRGWRGAR